MDMTPRGDTAGQLAPPPPPPNTPNAALPVGSVLSSREASGRVAWKLIERVGQGTTSVVWRARHAETGREAALKEAQGAAAGPAGTGSGTAVAIAMLAREARVLARVGRRWGPALLDAGPGFLVTEWIEGVSLESRLAVVADGNDRERLAAVVAHAVARGLEELHQAGVHHGDVKPANIVCAPDVVRGPAARAAREARDAAGDRGVTLIDLGLAAEAAAGALGGTPRYASPEVLARGEAGPAADAWALGLVIAEILDPAVARASDPRAAIALWDRGSTGARGGSSASLRSEIARWVEALLAPSPGGRPSAAWIARRAGRHLDLRPDAREAAQARVARVRRAYLAQRAVELTTGASASLAIGEPARTWIEGASIAALAPDRGLGGGVVEPLGVVRRSRWLVGLVGPSAAAWPIGASEIDEGTLVARVAALAEVREPASWTLEDLRSCDDVRASDATLADGPDRASRLVRELARPAPSPEALALAEDDVAREAASPTLAVLLASALARAGETGRAWVALMRIEGLEADALRAVIARRRGDVQGARAAANRVLACDDLLSRSSAKATLARLAWDADQLDAADALLEGARGPAATEVRGLIAWRRGAYEAGLRVVESALLEAVDTEARSRLEGVRGMLLHARGDHGAALAAFGRAVENAARAGEVVDEATYLTNEAAAATDAGDLTRALASATRAAHLWERLGHPERAARAWLARAAALSTLGALHATDEAASEARDRALEARDRRTAAYAVWARVEVRPPGDEQARAWVVEAAEQLRGSGLEDTVRAAARQLVWAPESLDDRALVGHDADAPHVGATARWEWWGARARAILAGRRSGADGGVLPALSALVDVPAPLASRGPALEAAVELATDRGDGESARRFELARSAAARTLVEGTPPEMRPWVASLRWARAAALEAVDVTFAPAQVLALEGIVRALSARDRLRPLLEQVLDTLVLWTGVERGLLLLRAPDGRLVPRAARNLARHDLVGEQLALSQTIARRAIETGDAVVATDALSSLGDAHASVHALRLRSVLAVPLLARGEALGVVYLDDRVRKGAFGPRELSWVRVVASQAAMAIADARDAVLLRRAARRAERARARVEGLLREREGELEATRTELQLTRDTHEHRYAYDQIAGRSEPMRDLLRLVDRVTASDVPVLVMGESGTGKELIARAIHANGARARRPFVGENCASVPETLLESTLFGHVRGAFTGASSTRAGLFDVADGGTLFLDEIGEMTLAMQAKLLRVLQDGEVRAVGSERSRKVDVRVIGATHRDLEAMVAAGTFREDLFYRLNVITLRVPALRERPEDIPLLFEHFGKKHGAGRVVKVTRAAMAKLLAFPWPGNVRQLENEVRRALVLADGPIDLPELSADVVRGGPSPSRESGLHLRSRVDALESALLNEALTKTRGNQTRAAQLLGLSRFGLQKMMKRLGVKVGD
jgi:transcriptional regulator with GAF, ATPase, and Fis domain/tetratricopeptide (TPR) repeat protein